MSQSNVRDHTNPRAISIRMRGLCKTFSVFQHQIEKEAVGNQNTGLFGKFTQLSSIDSPELYGILRFGSGGTGKYPGAGPSLQVVFKGPPLRSLSTFTAATEEPWNLKPARKNS